MRNANGIARALTERAEAKQAERRRTLAQLLGSLRRIRERREPWYVWVTEGQPILTAEQYKALGTKRATRRQYA